VAGGSYRRVPSVGLILPQRSVGYGVPLGCDGLGGPDDVDGDAASMRESVLRLGACLHARCERPPRCCDGVSATLACAAAATRCACLKQPTNQPTNTHTHTLAHRGVLWLWRPAWPALHPGRGRQPRVRVRPGLRGQQVRAGRARQQRGSLAVMRSTRPWLLQVCCGPGCRGASRALRPPHSPHQRQSDQQCDTVTLSLPHSMPQV
jgi:hypothetical protein